MKRSPMKRTAFKRKPKKKREPKGLFKHLEKESKTDEWTRIRKELDVWFIANNLYNYCELRLQGCDNMNLAYAHSKKRIDIAKDEPERTREMKEVVRACGKCHHRIEYAKPTEKETGREIMYRIVTETIKRRA